MRPRGEVHGPLHRPGSVYPAVVEHQLPVDPDPRAIVGRAAEEVGARPRRLEHPLELEGEVVRPVVRQADLVEPGAEPRGGQALELGRAAGEGLFVVGVAQARRLAVASLHDLSAQQVGRDVPRLSLAQVHGRHAPRRARGAWSEQEGLQGADRGAAGQVPEGHTRRVEGAGGHVALIVGRLRGGLLGLLSQAVGLVEGVQRLLGQVAGHAAHLVQQLATFRQHGLVDREGRHVQGAAAGHQVVHQVLDRLAPRRLGQGCEHVGHRRARPIPVGVGEQAPQRGGRAPRAHLLEVRGALGGQARHQGALHRVAVDAAQLGDQGLALGHDSRGGQAYLLSLGTDGRPCEEAEGERGTPQEGGGLGGFDHGPRNRRGTKPAARTAAGVEGAGTSSRPTGLPGV